MRVFNDIDSVVEWIEKMTGEGNIENWNIIVAGTSKGDEWITPYGTIHKVTRTRRKSNSEIDVIDIGVLRGPSDLVADVDQSILDDETLKKLKNYKVSESLIFHVFILSRMVMEEFQDCYLCFCFIKVGMMLESIFRLKNKLMNQRIFIIRPYKILLRDGIQMKIHTLHL